MSRSRNGTAAAFLSALGTVSVLLAFATSSWIVDDDDNVSGEPKFDRIGLWVICVNDYELPLLMYDTKFDNCLWVFGKKQYILHDILFQGFYSSTQVLFSICVTFSVLSLFFTTLYMMCFKVSIKRLIQILYTIWGFQLISVIFGTISLVLFGAQRYDRDWLPEWEHKCVGWSFIVAIVGTILIYISAILFIIEERVCKFKSRKSTKIDNHNQKELLKIVI